MRKLFVIPFLCVSLFLGSIATFAAEPVEEVEGSIQQTVTSSSGWQSATTSASY